MISCTEKQGFVSKHAVPRKIEAHVLFFSIYEGTSPNLILEPNYAGVSKDSAALKATEFSSISKITISLPVQDCTRANLGGTCNLIHLSDSG